MVPATEYSVRSKESTLWALAQQDPGFTAFYTEYREKITLTAPLPADLLDGVIEVVEQDPALAPAVKRYLENAQAASVFCSPRFAGSRCPDRCTVLTGDTYQVPQNGRR